MIVIDSDTWWPSWRSLLFCSWNASKGNTSRCIYVVVVCIGRWDEIDHVEITILCAVVISMSWIQVKAHYWWAFVLLSWVKIMYLSMLFSDHIFMSEKIGIYNMLKNRFTGFTPKFYMHRCYGLRNLLFYLVYHMEDAQFQPALLPSKHR